MPGVAADGGVLGTGSKHDPRLMQRCISLRPVSRGESSDDRSVQRHILDRYIVGMDRVFIRTASGLQGPSMANGLLSMAVLSTAILGVEVLGLKSGGPPPRVAAIASMWRVEYDSAEDPGPPDL